MLRKELTRVDVAGGDTGGLPVSLLEAIEAEGGLWWASDFYADVDEIVAKAREVGAVALRLDVRDLALLESLPGVRYLHLRSDGRPPLEPIATLGGLRALIIETGALRGEIDLAAFPELRWLHIGLGGKGGAAMLPMMARGHPALEWLGVREVRFRSVAEVAAGFPALRSLHVSYADYLRELGPLAEITPKLRALNLMLTQIRSLDGIGGLPDLETLALFGGNVTDLEPLRALRRLRHARLQLAHLTSIEPLRGHPSLRMLELTMAGEPDISVLESISTLLAVGRGKRFEQEIRWPDLYALELDDPLRAEWSAAMRG